MSGVYVGTYILGGSFDPIHDGHLSIARAILEEKNPEKILFIPAQRNPLKKEQPTEARHRWAMLQLALKEFGDSRVRGWEGELQRPGPSFMVDTLSELKRQGEKDLVLVLGNEVFSSFSQWKSPETIRAMAKLLVIDRSPHIAGIKVETGIERMSFPILNVSGTDLRRTLRETWKKGTEAVKPQGIGHSVWQYIKENRLYAVS